MVKSNSRAVIPPGSVTNPVGSVAKAGVFPKSLEAFLDWRARRTDDDQGSPVARMWSPDVWPVSLGASLHPRKTRIDPEDAAQEAWVVVLMRLPGFPGRAEGNLRAWLTVVVRNRLANLRRREAVRRQASLAPEVASLLVGHEDDPAVAFAREWIVEAVRAALEEAQSLLPEASYRVVRLKWIEGRTTLEIAEALGLSATQVRDRDRRALPVLGGLLKRRVRAELIGLFGEEFDSSQELGEVAS
jgi:RNA polymerase sigma factor (sigma-70 family)